VKRLPGKAAFAKELSGAEHGDHTLLALFRHHRQPDVARLYEKNGIGWIALSEDDFILLELADRAASPNRDEHGMSVEKQIRGGFCTLALSPGGGRGLVGHLASAVESRARNLRRNLARSEPWRFAR
jgi:hypothetical protein